MSYRLSPTETVGDGLRRILLEELDAAISCAEHPEPDLHDAVHRLRKRCKGARALVQLVRGSLPERGRENRRYRDIARRVSEVRDAASIVEAFDEMLGELNRDRAEELEPVRTALAERREAVVANLGIGDRLRRCRDELLVARSAAGHLQPRSDGWESITDGLRHWYRRGRRLWRRAAEEATTELLHEWRKCAKYHLYHLRLLKDIDPPGMERRLDRTGRLEDLLGHEHDLAVLETVLPGLAAPVSAREAAVRELGAERARLLAEALVAGEEAYVVSPTELVHQLEADWQRWRYRANRAERSSR